jgi:hypothetical protein
MARDLYGEMMGRALQRQAPQGHMPAFITQGEADVLRSLGGGVSPNGGQIMRNGIPSFQRYKGTDDAVLDYVIPSQYQEAAVSDPMNLFSNQNEIQPGKVNRFIENERDIAQEAQELQQADLDKQQADLDNMRANKSFFVNPVSLPPKIGGPTQNPLVQEGLWNNNENEQLARDFGVPEFTIQYPNIAADLARNQQAKARQQMLLQRSANARNAEASDWIDPVQPVASGLIAGGGAAPRINSTLLIPAPKEEEEEEEERNLLGAGRLLEDYGGFESEYGREGHDLGIVALANILKNIDRDPNTGKFPEKIDNLWDFMKQGGVAGHLYRGVRDRFSEKGRKKSGLAKDIYRKQRQLYKDAGLDEEEIRRIYDQSERIGLNPLRNAPLNVVGTNRLFGESDRDIAQRAQEEQQADLDRQLANELSNAIADAPPVSGDPDTELTEEEKHQERVERNIASLSPEYAWRLGLTDSQPPPFGSGIQDMPTPAGFSEPATYINPGAYPDIFVNDMTGERFTAPSLGYVPPSGWRRV